MAQPQFQPSELSRRDASGQIAMQLRKAINENVWEPGERLPTEKELADTFDVSRATAREAIKLLSATGLVQSTRGGQGGTFVTAPDADQVAEQVSDSIRLWLRVGNVTVHNVDEAREKLEMMCVALAAQHRNDEDLAAIRHAVDAARDLKMDIDEWLEWDLAFHTAISGATNNPILELAMMAVHLSRPATNTVFVNLLGRDEVLQQHYEISEAIAASDPERAQRALLAHVSYLNEVRRDALLALEVDDVPLSQLPFTSGAQR
jgi:GntR family transcriptional repressor for pyruvate dehydrogenase complex